MILQIPLPKNLTEVKRQTIFEEKYRSLLNQSQDAMGGQPVHWRVEYFRMTEMF